MALESLRSLFSSDLAIDFGTYCTLIFARGRGIVFSEPSVVALDTGGEMIAAGSEVAAALRKFEDRITVVRPLREGAITELDLAEKFVKYSIRKSHNNKKWVSPRVVLGVHPGMTQVERHALESCASLAGAAEVYLVETAIAAAPGAGVSISEPYGVMIVDIGGGTTDIDVISMGSSAYSQSSRAAGLAMDESIVRYFKRKYDLVIGPRTAETLKIALGSAFPLDEERRMEVRGRDPRDGELRTVEVNDEDIRLAMSDVIADIVNLVRVVMERTPPDLYSDILERGIVLTGGGSLLANLDRRLTFETGMPVVTAGDPTAGVVLGIGKTLSDFNLLRRLKWGNPLYGSEREFP